MALARIFSSARLAGLVFALLPLGFPGAEAAHAGTVTLQVGNVEPNGSAVYAALCQGGLERENCPKGDRRFAAGESVSFEFSDVPPGRYAVVVFQDINGNRALDRTPLGIPLEPYALSNGAGRKGRPNFEQAAIAIHEPGRALTLDLIKPRPRAP